MVIGCSFINVIGGYYWILVLILFVAINVFNGYLLLVIGGYSINGH
jgi:hypothetical protein